MTQEGRIQQIRRALVEEGQSDVGGLWAVLGQVKAEMPSWTAEESKKATLEVIRDALNREELVVGEFREHDGKTTSFTPWQVSVTDALRRIDAEWVALGREPNLGDIAWFVAPGLLPFSMHIDPMRTMARS
jgi:hypothetical protein